jgi:transposase InsO family protein
LATPNVCATGLKLQAAFANSGRTYGSRRLRTALAHDGTAIGRYRIRSLMKKHQLHPVWKRKFVNTTDSKHDLPISPNVLDRQFDVTGPNQAWVCDITYIRTRSGWLYLAAVMDLYARKIVGWACAPDMPAQLVCAAIANGYSSAQTVARPDRTFRPGKSIRQCAAPGGAVKAPARW